MIGGLIQAAVGSLCGCGSRFLKQLGYSGAVLRLYDSAEIVRHAETFDTSGDEDQKKRTIALLKKLHELGENRKLRMLSQSWRVELDALEMKFPHFARVIDYIREACALAESSRVIDLDNLLFEGSPGCGKSFFAEALAAFLNAGRVCLRMENAQSNSALCGSDSFWSNSAHGSVFENLNFAEFANPTFILDEIDKVSCDGRYDTVGLS